MPPYNTVRLVRNEEIFFSLYCRVVIRVWVVPKDNHFPNGIKYSLAFLFNNKRVLGYDNHEGKGHHRHEREKEEPNLFFGNEMDLKGVDRLIRVFWKEVLEMKKELEP
jgi:hypothetical protein